VQYQKLRPSPETDPSSAAKTSSALFEKLTQKVDDKQLKVAIPHLAKCTPNRRNTS
jgi:hypothetical protein